MTLFELILRREIRGTRYPIFHGLRPIRLSDILPFSLRQEVILGFTADGRFILSHFFESGRFKLSFWLVPGYCDSPNSWFENPFAVYTQILSSGRIDDQVGVRFLQSIHDPTTFALILSWGIENLTILWGTLPDPMCTECQQTTKINDKDTSFLCTKHFRFIRLSPDCQFSSKECVSVLYNESIPESDPETAHNPHQNTDKQVQSRGQSCECMSDLTASVHPSVCPKTGRLRLAWVSQGNQVRIISCSFGEDFPCTMPMGTYAHHRKNSKAEAAPPPLSLGGSFMTSNYCSSCYFWNSEACVSRCVSETSPVTPSSWVDRETRNKHSSRMNCSFSSLPVRVVTCPGAWPEGHRHPILLANNFLHGHKCLQPKHSFGHWTTSLLTSREKFRSCMPLNYLAMLQDIRASYIHWALVPTSLEVQQPASSLDGSHSLSPDKLLANRLCGQCHSYFDFNRWRPYDKECDASADLPVIAHMEEAVFDIPEFKENISDRVIFTSPLEPNWILVYDMDDLSMASTPRGVSGYQLVALIDVSTGHQLDPDEPSCAARLRRVQSRCPSSIRFSTNHITAENLTKSTSRPISTLLMELNNFSAMSEIEGPGFETVLRASLSYIRYPLCNWSDLNETLQGVIRTRVLQSPLPLNVLLTSGDDQPWRRLQLVAEDPNSLNRSDLIITSEYSSALQHPQVVYASASTVEVALDEITRLAYKSPAIVDVLISADSVVKEPFLWKCGLCVAQFTVADQSSVELIAAHLRLHTELRCCEKCTTILPNSPLAVDAPDAQQHRCTSLIIPRSTADCPSRVPQTLAIFPANGSPVNHGSSTPAASTSCAGWKRLCEPCNLGFATTSQYNQHIKNVHNKRRFVCPECRTTFSTKGNMTTHFQRVHNQSDSVTCPICSKRISNQFNLDRHIRLVHQGERQWEQEPSSVVVAGRSNIDESGVVEGASKHGYLLCMAPPPAAQSQELQLEESDATVVVADINVDTVLRRPKKTTGGDGNTITVPQEY
ncbi:hypothetical protein Aperf_G00000038082 [Anoplocephala perfoliata]